MRDFDICSNPLLADRRFRECTCSCDTGFSIVDMYSEVRLLNVNALFVNTALVKGALAWYGKLTWESAHAWNLIILCCVIVWGMTFIFMVHLSFYAIPLLIYDVMYDITTIP